MNLQAHNHFTKGQQLTTVVNKQMHVLIQNTLFNAAKECKTEAERSEQNKILVLNSMGMQGIRKLIQQ